MSAMPAAKPTTHFVIQGREVRLPVVVRDACSGAATYVVAADAARRLIPDALELAQPWPGRALCSIAAIQYRDNDLGDYNEVSIAFFVRERGSARGLPYVGTIADVMRGSPALRAPREAVNGWSTRRPRGYHGTAFRPCSDPGPS